MLDDTDHEIIRLLSENSRLQWREIGERVHLSGPAVANRVQRLEREGVIKAFTLKMDPAKAGYPIRAYIHVFMKTSDHRPFHDYLKSDDAVERADRISGDACYLVTVHAKDEAHLNRILENILKHGNYRINLAIGAIKEDGCRSLHEEEAK